MADPDPLLPFVRAWQAARAAGRDPPARELCPDHPDLIPLLSERLDALRRAEDSSAVLLGAPPGAAGTIRPPDDEVPAFRTPVRRRAAHPARVGAYRLLEPLGKGGMGAVYRAETAPDGRQVAVKLILPEAAADPTARARFVREAGVQAAIESEYVIPVHEVGEADGTPYLVLPLLRGETLEDRLTREPVVPVSVTLKVAREVAEGLAAADARGVVHRDIKPSNIWLEGDPSAADPADRFRRCLILDFGLARATGVPLHQITASRELLGTPAYMSPERVSGEPVDGRTDLFSLGAVLYEMATGKQPFESPNPFTAMRNVALLDPPPARSLNPAVPAELSDLIARLMAKNPDQRPRSARVVADAVRAMPVPINTPGETPVYSRLEIRPQPEGGPDTDIDSIPTRAATTAEEMPFLPEQPPRTRGYRVAAAVLLTAALVGVAAWAASRGGSTVERPPEDNQTSAPPSAQAFGGPIRLDPARIPAAERWPGAPAELVGVVGSGARQHFGGVGMVVAHPQGKWVATLPSSRPIRRAYLWDPSTLAPAGTLEWGGDLLGQFALSRDGRTLAAGERFGPVALNDVSGPDPKPLGRLPIETVAHFTFLADGSLLTAEGGGRLTRWGVSDGGPRRRSSFTLPPLDFDRDASTRVQEMVVSADGSTLAINCVNQAVRLWDLSRETPVELGVLHRPGRFWIGAAFGPDGKTLYTADFSADEHPGASVRAWHLTGTGVKEVGLIARDTDDSRYVEFALSPDGKQLAVSTLRAGVLRFDVSGPTPRPLPAIDFSGEVGSAVRLAFGPDANTLFTGGAALRAWDLGGSRPVERAPFDASSRVTGSVLAADGALVAAHADGKLRVWNLTGPAPSVRRELIDARSGTASGKLAVTADAATAVQVGRPDLTVWTFGEPDPVRLGCPDTVSDLALTPDGRHLLTSSTRTVTLWDRRGPGFAPRSDQQATGGWGRCAIAPDGRWVAAVELHAGVRLFEAAGDRLRPVLVVPNPAAGIPVFSPDGSRLLVIGRDLARPVRCRLTEQGWVEEPFPDRDGYPRLHEAAFFPDGRSFVAIVKHAGSDDTRLEVWQWDTGEVSRSVLLPGRVTGLSVAADGRHVATHNDNGTVYLFRL